ncbi:hypothetical protein PF003_g29831 [Phytophthora fragariae]|nr:hypothetical protein PF003_g29831 [Phytophthora fragariae]
MAASPAVSLAAGIRSPAPVYSTSPSATAARVVAASPSCDECSVHAPTSPAAQADSGRAPSAALVADTADPAGEASDGDSGLNGDIVRLWDELERCSRFSSLDRPGSGSWSPAPPSVSPASPAPRENVGFVSVGGLSPPPAHPGVDLHG